MFHPPFSVLLKSLANTKKGQAEFLPRATQPAQKSQASLQPLLHCGSDNIPRPVQNRVANLTVFLHACSAGIGMMRLAYSVQKFSFVHNFYAC